MIGGYRTVVLYNAKKLIIDLQEIGCQDWVGTFFHLFPTFWGIFAFCTLNFFFVEGSSTEKDLKRRDYVKVPMQPNFQYFF